MHPMLAIPVDFAAAQFSQGFSTSVTPANKITKSVHY